MSDPMRDTDELERIKAESTDVPRSSTLSVFGVLFVLLLVAGGVAALARPPKPPLEPAQVLGEFFDVSGLPDGFGAEGARRLPGGETLVTLRPGIAPTAGVEELRFVRYPRSRAKAVQKDQFQNLRFERAGGGSSWGGGGRRGGGSKGRSKKSKSKPKLQDAGTFPWHGYEARFARLRHRTTGEGGLLGSDPADGSAEPFYDTIRVNLTTADQCLIAYARFTQDSPGLVEDVARLLVSFQPR